MKLPIIRMATNAAILGASMLAVGMLCYGLGARVNTTRSIPLGLYWVSEKPADRSEYVLLCPPQIGVMAEAKRRGYLVAGFCPGEYGYMMKKIMAVPDDAVAITDVGVNVNGAWLPHSAPRSRDASGRPMPRYQHTEFIVGKHEFLLMSDVSETSFDARYFGPVNRSQIQSVIEPVFTW